MTVNTKYCYMPRILLIFLCLLLTITLTACGDEPEEEELSLPPSDISADQLPVLPQPEEPPLPTLEPAEAYARPDRVRFGTVKIGELQEQEMIIGNKGQEILSISDIRIVGSKDGIEISNNCQDIRPSDQCTVTITYEPTGVGRADAEIIIAHTGTNTPTLVNISGVAEEEQVQAPPAPQQPVRQQPQIIYVMPPPPTDNVQKALELQEARRWGGLQSGVQQTANPFEVLTLNDQDPDYLGLGWEGTLSSYPVDRSRIITADRYIPAVMENSINSEIAGGRVVAVVENHVYSGTGRNVLLPAGSRVVGFYKPLQQGQTRLDIEWNRIIRPDGVGITILEDRTTTDAMGRAGVPGEIDYRFWERFGVPLLISTIAATTDYLLTDEDSEVTTIDGGASLSSTVNKREQVQDEYFEDVSDIVQQLIDEQGNSRPVITIAAGTRIYITPTQDIYFKQPTLLAAVEGTPRAQQDFANPTPNLNQPAQPIASQDTDGVEAGTAAAAAPTGTVRRRTTYNDEPAGPQAGPGESPNYRPGPQQ